MPPPRTRRGKSVPRRSFKRDGHNTAVTLEDAFWTALNETNGHLIATINHERRERQNTNLSSAIRLFVLNYYRQQKERGPMP